jgi:hypothetical protein
VIGRAFTALKNAVGNAFGRAQGVGAYASSRSAVARLAVGRSVTKLQESAVGRSVTKLQESAIEPLPQVERMPRPLRELEWQTKQDGGVDAAAIIRRLRSVETSPEERNELGCAYAVLAWEKHLDAHWLSAIEELTAAAARGDEDVKRRAKANLDRVADVSGFPA